MKASTPNKPSWLLAAIFASLACLAYPQKSLAAETLVTCNSPVAWLSALNKPGNNPMEVVYCSAGSSLPGISFFAYRISDNPDVAIAIPTLVGNWVLVHGSGSSIKLYTDPTNLSGGAWGCGTGNCRVLDQLLGY